ncbi:MAG TPA: hypothetical protein VFM29_06670 [Vicinamibacteria bacterium]|nr:hypothetical protein [Vicinamibacteria bacterium]
MPRAAFAEILQLLAAQEVEFVVVGMTAGVLQGAPLTTLDLDVVHRRTPQNVGRLLGVLAELDATYRHDPRGLRPQESHLLGPGHQLLRTRLGDLDCLGAIGDGAAYEDLLPHTVAMRLSGGASIRVLGLAALIELKERAGRPKDLAVLPVLRATLEEAQKGR